jgi:hypothetical protein
LNDEIENHYKNYKRTKEKKVEIQTIKTTSDNIIFSKLRLNDEIKNK